MTHIVINNAKGTVKYLKDSTAMLKTELPSKIAAYMRAVPCAKHIHLYPDQVEWLSNAKGWADRSKRQVMAGLRANNVELIEVLREI